MIFLRPSTQIPEKNLQLCPETISYPSDSRPYLLLFEVTVFSYSINYRQMRIVCCVFLFHFFFVWSEQTHFPTYAISDLRNFKLSSFSLTQLKKKVCTVIRILKAHLIFLCWNESAMRRRWRKNTAGR
jgi:hypothetical protein